MADSLYMWFRSILLCQPWRTFILSRVIKHLLTQSYFRMKSGFRTCQAQAKDTYTSSSSSSSEEDLPCRCDEDCSWYEICLYTRLPFYKPYRDPKPNCIPRPRNRHRVPPVPRGGGRPPGPISGGTGGCFPGVGKK